MSINATSFPPRESLSRESSASMSPPGSEKVHTCAMGHLKHEDLTAHEIRLLKALRSRNGTKKNGSFSEKELKIIELYRKKKSTPPSKSVFSHVTDFISDKTAKAVASLHKPFDFEASRKRLQARFPELPRLLTLLGRLSNNLAKSFGSDYLKEYFSLKSGIDLSFIGVDALGIDRAAESAFLTGAENLIQRLNELDKDGELLKDLTLRLSYLLNDYTGKFIEARNAAQSLDFQTPDDERDFIVSFFGADTPLALRGKSKEQKLANREAHLKLMSQGLLEVLLPNGKDDLAVHDSIKEYAYKLVADTVLPNVIDNGLIKTLMRPDIMDTIFINSLNNLPEYSDEMMDETGEMTTDHPAETTAPLPVAGSLLKNLAYMLLPRITDQLVEGDKFIGHLGSSAIRNTINNQAGVLLETKVKGTSPDGLLNKGIHAALLNLWDSKGRYKDVPRSQGDIEQRHTEAVERIAKLLKTSILSPFASPSLRFDRWALRQRGVLAVFSGSLYFLKKITETALRTIASTLAYIIPYFRRFGDTYKDEQMKAHAEFLVNQLSSPAIEILYFQFLDDFIKMLNPTYSPEEYIRSTEGGIE